jgi:hypothetical protein
MKLLKMMRQTDTKGTHNAETSNSFYSLGLCVKKLSFTVQNFLSESSQLFT